MDEIIPSILYSLPGNILQKINYIQQDYVGLRINYYILEDFFINLLFAIFTVFLSYSLGKKIFSLLKDTTKTSYNYLVLTAIGYIAIASGVTILGLFSFFNFTFITLYLFFIIFYTLLLPFSLKENLISFFNHIKKDFKHLKRNNFVFVWTILFIFIATLNLINPEVREDQYHTDLPIIYLKNQTIMIPPKEKISVSASPLLSEMYYAPGILYLSKGSARYMHFTFYIVVLLTLINFSKLKRYKFAIYTPLLFASAPVVIHETSSMYVDFQWIFCFLLSILVLLDRKNNKSYLVKSGLLFGEVLATKLWTIVFSMAFVLFLSTTKETINKKAINISIFILFVMMISSVWFLRAYVLTGNPLYPAFNNTGILNFVGINYQLLDIFSFINVFSLIFFVSFIFLIYKLKINIKKIYKLELFRYLFFLLFIYLIINYPFGRYLLGLYVIFIFLNSFAIDLVYNKFKSLRIFLNSIVLIVFSYYLLSSVLVLPYSLGILDKNKYLTRILSRDNSSYYDFDRKFDKFFSDKDLVATYEIYGFYYANFNYIYADYILSKTKDLKSLKKEGATKLFIKGGNINWLCNKINPVKCNYENYELLSKYSAVPYSGTEYYLYAIK